MPFYFAYGSNINRDQMTARCPGAQFIAVASLPQHRLCFPRASEARGGGVASVTSSRSKTVWGVIWKLSDVDMVALDRHEGVPTAYTRGIVDVQLANTAENSQSIGGRITAAGTAARACHLYLAVPELPGKHLPSRAYVDCIVTGARQFNLPADWLDYLQSLPTKDDAPA